MDYREDKRMVWRLAGRKTGVEVHYVQPSYFEERDSDMDIYLFLWERCLIMMLLRQENY